MPELLSPAGNFEKLKAAVLYGADAVYLAGTCFGMRAPAGNFTNEELKEAVEYAHARSVKVYLTVNVMPRWDEYDALEKYLCEIKDIGVDALIIADIGVLALAKKIMPHTDIHISTQASAVSHASCIEWYNMGASRVVLARELRMAEILEIKKRIPSALELEAFIHGSMCVSYSGRCLLSEYYTGRDANRGKCAQPCRWEYNLYEIGEVKRDSARLPIEIDERGSYVMSSKDMCMIEHIPELMESGITSFKIEGRMKSAYYTAVTTNAYRMAMDTYIANGENYKFNPEWKRELESVSHREYCTGFYYDDSMENAQLSSSTGYLREKAYLAYAVSYDPDTRRARFVQRNKMCAGEQVELMSPGKTGRAFCASQIWDDRGEIIDSTPHPFMEFEIEVPFEVKAGDILRGA